MVSDHLSRGFAPIDFETQVDHLTTEGRWPADLSGTLYRIGPNPQFEPIEPYNPLLGDGMVHAFRIGGPDIGYRNRWVRTQQWRLEHEAGRALFATSGDPRHNDPLAGTRPTDGAANTSLFWHAGRLLALEEAHAPLVLDPLTLETLGGWDFHGRLPSNMTAHPKLDPETGEAIFFANYPGGRFDGEIAWYVADREGHITSQHTLTAPFPAIVHDFGVTRDYVVFPICPATISLPRARSGGPAIAWEPDKGTHVALVRRDTPHDVTWFTAPARFVWHVLNCWNEDEQVIVDLCEQAAPAFPAADGSMSPETLWCQRLSRWELSPGGRPDARIRRLADQVCEYPRSDERFAMRPTGHGYFACHGGPGTGDPFHRGVAHFDFGSGRMSTFCFGPTSAVSEPVFVPRGETAAEGGGYVLCLVYEEDRDRSCIAVLDAQRVADGPLAGAWLEHRVPMGFHGCWIGENDLGG
jgi:carotenoid cleavage dioxygenase-like enzyme